MFLKRVIIENFRCYKNKIAFSPEVLTTFVGKNDSGKSSILEALDYFFNYQKLDPMDRSIFCTPDELTTIGCVFTNFPDESEFLLNEDGDLEIWKQYNASGKQTVYIRAMHPSNDGFSDLLSKKMRS